MLLNHRQVVGPYNKSIAILIEFPGSPSQCVVRFRRAVDVDRQVVDDDETMLFKLPAGRCSVLELSEVDGGQFLVNVQVLPRVTYAENLPDPNPPPVALCMGPCPPYCKKCPEETVPMCIDGELTCVAKGDGTKSEP